MSRTKDIAGEKFGLLTAVMRVENDANGKSMWLCKCKCGTETVVRANDLRMKKVKSCGCHKKQGLHRTHGLTYSGDHRQIRLYRIWSGMKTRCYNKNHHSHEGYGDRGISVCDEWRNSFEAFYNWALANGYRDDLTIDRKDNEQGYSPENCHWATAKEQANNRTPRQKKSSTANN